VLDTIELDSLQAGSISVPGSDTGYQSVWLVPASHYPYGRMSYAYSAEATGVMETNPKPQTLNPKSASGPTVLRAGARLRLPSGTTVFSTAGRAVTSAADLNPGIYWLTAAGQRRKLVVVR
jgi:hypothetical protein